MINTNDISTKNCSSSNRPILKIIVPNTISGILHCVFSLRELEN